MSKKKKPTKKKSKAKHHIEKKHNLIKLFEEWLTGKDRSLKAFSKRNKVPYQSVMKMSAKGKWIQRRRELADNTEDRIAEINAEKIAEARMKHLKHSDLLQRIGSKRLKKKGLKMKAGEAISALTKGISIERTALGMDDEKTGQGAQVVNNVQAVIAVFNDEGKKKQEGFRKAIRKLIVSGSTANRRGGTS